MRTVRIFVSSPADAGHERDRLGRVAARLNVIYANIVHLELIRWEDEFYRAHDTFQRQIPEARDCDIVIGLLKHRLGSPLPGDFPKMPEADPYRGEPYASGTAYEILSSILARTLEAGERPDIYVFRYPEPPLVPAGSPQAELATGEWVRLQEFAQRYFFTASGEFRFAFQTFRSTDDFERQAEALLRIWIERNVVAGRRAIWPVDVKGSPFRALMAFDADHADVFFGRERETARAVEMLTALADEQAAGGPVAPFLLVFGPSGAGKSSFARAGIVPAIQRETGAVVEWRVAVMRPTEGGLDPFRVLAAHLFAPGDAETAKALPELADTSFPNPDALAAQLRHGDASAAAPLLDALRRISKHLARREGFDTPPAVRLLLVIDQFDDLFVGAADGEGDGNAATRAPFARLLQALVSSGAVSVVATLRTGLYERFSAEPELKALKAAGRVFELDPPDATELAAIVREPANAADLVFEADPAGGGSLDERLLADFDRPDMLPLLQFALSRLFEERRPLDGRGGLLTFEAYQRMGGIAGAVQTAANRALAGLGDAERACLPRLFRLLVEAAPSSGSREGQGPSFGLVDVPAATLRSHAALWRLTEALIEERILVADVGPNGAKTVALAHRRVPDLWTEAREAVAANALYYRAVADLRPGFQRWAEAGRPWRALIADDILLREGVQLTRDFAEDTPPEIASFVRQSVIRARLKYAALSGVAATLFAALLVAGYFLEVARTAEKVAAEQRDAANRNLTIARETIDGVVTDITDGLKDAEGMSAAIRNRIVGEVRRSADALLEKAPDDAALQATRWNVLISVGDAYLAVGENELAGDTFRDSLDTARGLVARDAGNTVWRRDQSVSLERVGDAELAAGATAKAGAAYGEALILRRALATAAPSDDGPARDLSVGLEKVGDVLATRDPVQALAAYRESRDIRQRLRDASPDDPVRLRDLAVSWTKIADVAFSRGEGSAALDAYQQALAISRSLAAADKTDTGRRRDLSVSLDRLGDALLATDPAAALAAYAESADVREALVATDRSNVLWVKDLSISLANTEEARRRLAALQTPALRAADRAGTVAAKIVAIPASLRGGLDVSHAGEMVADDDVRTGRLLDAGDQVSTRPPDACEGVKIFDGRALHDLSTSADCRFTATANRDGGRILSGLTQLAEAFAADDAATRERATLVTQSRSDDEGEPLALVEAVPSGVVQSLPAGFGAVHLFLRHGASDFTFQVEALGAVPSPPLTTRARRASVPLPALDTGATAMIVVIDADGTRLAVPYRVVAPATLPLPLDGLPVDALIGDDRAAYAYWLLKQDDPQWRLLALSLLNRAGADGSAQAETFLARLARGS